MGCQGRLRKRRRQPLAIDAATVAKMVSEALFALELDIGVGVPTGMPAAVEPAAAVATVSAMEPAAVERERPELTDEPAAAPREYLVLNSQSILK